MPRPLVVAAGWSWRVLAVGVAAYAAVYAFSRIQLVVLPLIGALLLATFLYPLASRLRARRFPRSLAALTVLVGFLAVVIGIGLALAWETRGSAADLDLNVRRGIRDAEDWLVEGPLGLSRGGLRDLTDRATEWAQGAGAPVGREIFGGALIAVDIAAGIVLMIFLLFFFLKDGDRMWGWLLRRVGEDARPHVRETGERAWNALAGYVRGQTVVAAIDAVFIGAGAFLLGVPFVIPIAVLTFFAAYFPIVGAVVAGAAAVLVALAAEGLTTALILLAVVVAVQQIEGNLLAPLVMSRTVRLHPVVVVLALGAGGALGGIVGAFLAVPVTAALTAAGTYVWAQIGPEDQREEISAREERRQRNA